MSFMVLTRHDFKKWARATVLAGVMYPVLLALGQWLGQ